MRMTKLMNLLDAAVFLYCEDVNC